MSTPLTYGIGLQVRTGSSRCPGKALLPIENQPMLEWQLRRLRGVREEAVKFVATTPDPADDALAELCQRSGWAVYRGFADDLVRRYREAARELGVDVVVRVGGDDPLIDPQCVEALIRTHRQAPEVQFLYGLHRRGWIYGTAAELIRVTALDHVIEHSTRAEDREHVTPYLFRHPERILQLAVPGPEGLCRPDFCVSVDHPADFELVKQLLQRLGEADFSQAELVALLDRSPELRRLNAGLHDPLPR